MKHQCPKCLAKFTCYYDGCRLGEDTLCDMCYSHKARNVLAETRGDRKK